MLQGDINLKAVFPVARGGEVDLPAISRLANRLRGWAPAILQETARSRGEQARLQELMRLRDATQLLDTLAQNLLEAVAKKKGDHNTLHSTSRLLSCMRLMMHARNRNDIPIVVSRALDTVLAGFPARLDDEVKLPHSSTLSRNQVALDAAILLVHRPLFQKGPCLYLLADSPPQCAYHLYLSMILLIPAENVRRAFQVASELSSCVYARGIWTDAHADRTAEHVDSDIKICDGAHEAGRVGIEQDVAEQEAGRRAARTNMISILQRRAALASELEGYMTWITNFPLCLGQGAASLVTKVRLILHMLWMFASKPWLEHLAASLACVVSFTTDVGTEMGLADFEAPSIRATMAPWMFPSRPARRVFPADDGRGDVDGDSQEEDPDEVDLEGREPVHLPARLGRGRHFAHMSQSCLEDGQSYGWFRGVLGRFEGRDHSATLQEQQGPLHCAVRGKDAFRALDSTVAERRAHRQEGVAMGDRHPHPRGVDSSSRVVALHVRRPEIEPRRQA